MFIIAELAFPKVNTLCEFFLYCATLNLHGTCWVNHAFIHFYLLENHGSIYLMGLKILTTSSTILIS